VPSPRKERAASRSIATAPVTATWTTMGVIAYEQNGPEHEVAGTDAERPGRHHELALLEREGAGAREARERGDAHDPDRQHGVERSRAQNGDDDHGEENCRYREEKIQHPHDPGVRRPSDEPAQEAQRDTHCRAHEHGDGPGEEGDPRPVDHPAQDVATELVRAEGMGEGG
jgi:hypothetical protein